MGMGGGVLNYSVILNHRRRICARQDECFLIGKEDWWDLRIWFKLKTNFTLEEVFALTNFHNYLRITLAWRLKESLYETTV